MAFAYRAGALCAEQVSLEEIARRFGTPCYIYSRSAIEANFAHFSNALAGRKSLIAYSVKANSNLAVLDLMARLGAGFDIVSGGELARVLAAGGDPRKVVFSGVGKTQAEIEQALHAGILCLNLESEAELERVSATAARLGVRAPIALRVNPDVDAKTHPYISTGLKDNKFGVAYADAERIYAEAARHSSIELVGIGCHIGSQMAGAAPFVDAATRILALTERLARVGIRLSHIDLGGGFGIRYRDEFSVTGIKLFQRFRLGKFFEDLLNVIPTGNLPPFAPFRVPVMFMHPFHERISSSGLPAQAEVL